MIPLAMKDLVNSDCVQLASLSLGSRKPVLNELPIIFLAAATSADPRQNTPWQVLYDSRDDCAFITTMGINCATFDDILDSGFREHWESSSIPPADANPGGAPRL